MHKKYQLQLDQVHKLFPVGIGRVEVIEGDDDSGAYPQIQGRP
jgi:hypothetical protein